MSSSPLSNPEGSHRLWWILGTVVLVLAAIVAWRLYKAGNSTTGRPGFGGPVTVGTGKVSTADVPIVINALGTVTPLATVTVHPQITGPITKIAFTEGQTVKQGDLLAIIDPRPFQAAYDQAKGQLARDDAQLSNSRVDLDRYKTLLSQNSVSDQQYATQKATVAQNEGIVATDRAALEAAGLNLSYTRITAPVSGLVGLRQVDIGNLVAANTSTIAVVTQMQPMSVVFTVPEDSVRPIRKHLAAGEKLAVTAFDRAFAEQIAAGTLANADNEIDPTTGTLKLRAMFDNSKSELFPSQFVNVRLTLETLAGQTVVPGAAVQTGSSGSYVYLVDVPSSTVHMRAVTTGPGVGDQVSITAGLTVGDTVVTDGSDQLRAGLPVVLPGAAGAAGATGKAAASGGSSGWRHHRDGQGSSSSSGGGSKHREGGSAPPPGP